MIFLQLFVLVLVELTVSAVFQVPLIRKEPPMVQMIRKGTWTSHIKEMNEMRLKRFKSLAGAKQHSFNLFDYHDMSYLAKITIGDPEQSFLVVPDTGSADFWVPDAECAAERPPICSESRCDLGMACEFFCREKSCCKYKRPEIKDNPCKGKNYFDATKSKTYREMEGTWSIEYGTGKASGVFGNDTVRFGVSGDNRLTVPGCKFGRAEETAKTFADLALDGILGLAFPAASGNGAIPVFTRAYQLNLVEPVFTVYMTKNGWEADGADGGMITYGGEDKEHCGDLIAWEKLTRASYWQFELKGITVGDYSNKQGWSVISDTGSSLIVAPVSVVEGIQKAINATYNRENKLYYVDCNSEHNLSAVLTIGENNYTISAKNLVIRIEDEKGARCLLAISSTASFFGPQWVIGDPFIREYCNIHDMANERIGFAKSK